MQIEREVFEATTFSTEPFVDGISQPVLHQVMLQLLHPELVEPSVLQSSSTDRVAVGLPPIDFLNVASQLCHEHEVAKKRVAELHLEEQLLSAKSEASARGTEVREKTLLSKVRIGLDETFDRLGRSEDKLSTVIAATTTIDNHLSLLSNRVKRGRAVCDMLDMFGEFNTIEPSNLRVLLERLRNVRKKQRNNIATDWKGGYAPLVNASLFIELEGGGGSAASKVESDASSAGLSHSLVRRSDVPDAVEWVLQLLPLSQEMVDLFPTASENVGVYAAWLQKELVDECFFLVDELGDLFESEDQQGLGAASPVGKAFLQALEEVSSIYVSLVKSNDELLEAFVTQSAKKLNDALQQRLKLTPLPPIPPLAIDGAGLVVCDIFASHTKAEIGTIMQHLLSITRRDLTVADVMGGVSSSATQQRLLSQLVSKAVRPFLIESLTAAEDVAASLIAQEGRLSPRSKRKSSARVTDAVCYSLMTLSELYQRSVELVHSIEEVVEQMGTGPGQRESVSKPMVQQLLKKGILGVFDERRKAYKNDSEERALLARYLVSVDGVYIRDLATNPDAPYDYRFAHSHKMKEVVARTEECLTRGLTLAGPVDASAVVQDICNEAYAFTGKYLQAEIRKALDSCLLDVPNWQKVPKVPQDIIKTAKQDAHICAIRILIWAQTSLVQLGDTVSKIGVPLFKQNPQLSSSISAIRAAAMSSCDEKSEELINAVMRAIIVRSLSILTKFQHKGDYRPKGPKYKKGNGSIINGNSEACLLFCKFLSVQLEEAHALIRISCTPLPAMDNRSTALDSSAHKTTSTAIGARGGGPGELESVAAPSSSSNPPAGIARAGSPAGSASQGGGGKGLTSKDILSTMSLKQMLYPESPTFVRVLGAALYKGIVAHLRDFFVNDEGALVFKNDVSKYRETLEPLVSGGGLDGVVVGVLFDIIKQASNLMIVPLDNIASVKNSGLLQLLSNDEKTRYLKMRSDLRDAFRRIGK